jgi:tetratricopeptide (TPR) repeat protein
MSDDYETHIRLGDACSCRGEHQDAARHYQTATALRPDADEPIVKISKTFVSGAREHLQRLDYSKALQLLQRAMALDIESPHIDQNLILAYTACCEALLATGNVNAAIRIMQHLLLLNPDQPKMRLRLDAARKSQRDVPPSALRSQRALLPPGERVVLFIPTAMSSGKVLLGQILTEILCEEYGFTNITYHTVSNTRQLINYPIPQFDYLQALDANHNNAFLCWQYFYREEVLEYLKDPQIKPVMMKRDPRDALVSTLNLFYHNDQFNKITNNRTRYQSFDAYVNAHLVEGARWFVEYYKSWSSIPGMYQISFEQIKKDGFSCIKNLLTHAGLNVPSNLIYRALYLSDFRTITGRDPGDEVKNPAGFMRSGVSGEWSIFFSLRQQRVLKRELGQLLIDLGYERDVFW